MFKKFIKKFIPQKHNFILEKTVEINEKYSIPQYKCSKCGANLMLAHWQMKSLPFAMEYGCNGN